MRSLTRQNLAVGLILCSVCLVLCRKVSAQSVSAGSNKTDHGRELALSSGPGSSRANLGSGSLRSSMDRDLLEITIPKLEKLYETHRYTVTEVVRWYIDRVERYNGIYRAITDLDTQNALATATREDKEMASTGHSSKHGPLWGVPIVIKANTSVQGWITSDGWKGFAIPGHELRASRDATVVKKLRDAGAIILGQTNMPDFADSDTTRSSAFGRTGNAYDVRFSPGGSSGGAVTAITANFALLATGTDTSNSIRMPAGTSAVVGLLPTRGLVSTAGAVPLDWLLDNVGPIARDVTDAAIALDVMEGEDSLDLRTTGASSKAQPGPYTQYLKEGTLKGKRFGVPAFILTPKETRGQYPLRPETREAFMKALDGLRAAGATVVIEDDILSSNFLDTIDTIKTRPYRLEGLNAFLKNFGANGYKSAAEYKEVTGTDLPTTITGISADSGAGAKGRVWVQTALETDPDADGQYFEPQRAALAEYNATLERLHLDGFVYPTAQMPPPDETMPQDGQLSDGPDSNTGWVNWIGVPAVAVPAGFYPNGLPFGLELSGRQWRDGDLLSWAYAYEQATHSRRPPTLIDKGLLPNAR